MVDTSNIKIKPRKPHLPIGKYWLVISIYVIGLLAWIMTLATAPAPYPLIFTLLYVASWITAAAVYSKNISDDWTAAASLWLMLPLAVATFPIGPIIWAISSHIADKNHEKTELMKQQIALLEAQERSPA